MILQNISRAIREQNYYAVFLEFVIVIAGVVIGFQINAWNEDQQARREEEAALHRLLEESVQALTYIDAEIGSSVASVRLLERAVAALTRGALGELTLDKFRNGVWGSANYPALTPPRAVIDELINGGRIGLIKDTAVREAMSHYNRSLQYYAQQLPYFRDEAPRPSEMGGAAFGSVYRPDLPGRRVTHVDFDVLVANNRFVQEITGGIYGQTAMIAYRRAIRNRAFDLCHAVAEALERECPADPLILKVFPNIEEPAP